MNKSCLIVRYTLVYTTLYNHISGRYLYTW